MPANGQPLRVLVTGVGAAPGLELARALLRRGHEVIGADADPLAAGFVLPGLRPMILPRANDRDYREALLDVCKRDRVQAILPGLERELPALIELRHELRHLGAATWLPSPEAVHLCGDKAAFALRLDQCGIPKPPTWFPHQIAEIPGDAGRLVVKPRRGHGGHDTYFCDTPRQAAILCELTPEPIVQQAVHGQEFTADCLVDESGHSSVILRYRLRVKGGLAVVAETFHDPAVTELVRRTLAAAEVVGICCVQGFITPGRQVQMTEVNLRIAGAFAISEAAGADLVGQYLNSVTGMAIDHSQLSYRPGIRLVKAVDTLAMGQADRNGSVTP